MARSVSVVVPVKDGERYLDGLLRAVLAQAADAATLEVLVIDSGSRDASVAIAREAGATVLEIAPAEFGHGRTRNLAAEHTSGELICFLTQDATPLPGWLAAYQEAFALDPRVGAAYGPHRPRPDTSPMIARELREFFLTHGPDDGPTLQQGDDANAWLSNVNACYRRECWEQLRFADVRYSEDQAFGTAMMAAGWKKVYAPGAAVLHAHDYPPVQFMRRYFDEYRGLRETIGHVEGAGLRSGTRDVRSLVAADRRWMREQGWEGAVRARWTARAPLPPRVGRGPAPGQGRAGAAEGAPGRQRRRAAARRRARAAVRPGVGRPHVDLPAADPARGHGPFGLGVDRGPDAAHARPVARRHPP
jgi:glycosyltransferase involved in cell wall biosynthesis